MARRWPAGFFALFLALFLSLGCEETTLIPRTQVLVLIDATPSVKARAAVLRVSLESGKGDPAGFESAPEQLFVIDEAFRWPASLALLPKGGDAERGFRISVEALEGERVFVSSRVISTFLDKQTLLLEIVLQDGCIDFMSCADDQTCQVSQGLPACVSAKVDPRDLDVVSKAPGRDLRDASSVREPDASVAALPDAAPAELDASEPDADGPDAGEPDASEPDASGPDAGEPDASEPDAGPCVPAAEDCFNGRDDDCDLLPDCVDTDCNARAVCTPDAAELALKLPGGSSCPAGYTRSPRQLHRDLASTGCSGCACGSAGTTTCTASITAYGAPAGCFGALQALGSASYSQFACSAAPLFAGAYEGMGVNSITATPGSCPASGTPRPGALSWGSDSTLCYLERKGTGCGAGNVCVPRHDARPLCAEGPASCSGAETRETWYSGVNDMRSCGACSCTPSGASCSNVSVSFGYNFDCNGNPAPVVMGAGEQRCGAFVNAPVALIGTPARATCAASAPIVGMATPTGPTTLCCRP